MSLTDEVMERKQFEEWFEDEAMPLESNWFAKDSDGDYINSSVAHAWDGWKARAKRTSPDEARIQKLEAENKALKAKLADAKKDAARSENDRIFYIAEMFGENLNPNVNHFIVLPSKDQFDEYSKYPHLFKTHIAKAIDKAITTQEK